MHICNHTYMFINLGTDEMVDMNEFAKIAMSFEGKELPIKHIPGSMMIYP
jgi:GDP-D-mannose 3',5'-epimerase